MTAPEPIGSSTTDGNRETPSSATASSSCGGISASAAGASGAAAGAARVSTSGDIAGIVGLVRLRYSAVDSDGALGRFAGSGAGAGSAGRGGLGLGGVAVLEWLSCA